ncbi:hypothetical protein PIB30_048518 [Stylosanthes scabra]|uniref:Uncharacterized protein n=1 Tax=Stylosanthes scabra TaxID=79078 RepID=A0ABU6YEE4_9FABA|nr:hypothetical protein [Stylosanthes scabra]
MGLSSYKLLTSLCFIQCGTNFSAHSHLNHNTFDVSLLTIKGKVFKVKATAGNTHLGGADFDIRVLSYFVKEFERKNKVYISGNARALRRLRIACEKAKRTLSYAVTASIDLDAFLNGIDFYSSIMCARFEELNMDLFRECVETIDQCLTDAKMDKASVHDVVLIGGSSRIPKVQELLQEIFKGKELCKSINPDEAVAYGAAIKAALLNAGTKSNVPDLVLQDVTPLSLDHQVAMRQNIYEGERTRASNNNLLGTYKFSGIPPTPKGRQSGEEIERLVKEAARHKVEDDKFLKKAKAINALDDYVYDMEKTLNLNGSELCPEDKKKLNSIIDKARNLLDDGNKEKTKNDVFVEHLKEAKLIF